MKGLEERDLSFTVKTDGHTYSGGWSEYHGGLQYDMLDENTGKQFVCNPEASGTTAHAIWLNVGRSCFGKPRWISASVFIAGKDVGGRWFVDNHQGDAWDDLVDHYTRRLHWTR